MGNCQAAETATVVIQHPGPTNIKVERIYWSVSAIEVMSSNPGYYVAHVFESSAPPNGPPVTQLKLLRPDDTLHLGHVYRLITFEDVLKEFAAKKSVKLGKLLKESGVISADNKNKFDGSKQDDSKIHSPKVEQKDQGIGSGISSSSGSRGVGRHHGGSGHWKPALQSIAEFGN